MPWTREEKIFYITPYLEMKSFKTVQARFHCKFDLAIIPRKAKFIIEYTRSIDNFNKKAENPRSSRKLTARSPDNVDAVSEGVRKSPSEDIPKNLVFHVHCRIKSINFCPCHLV